MAVFFVKNNHKGMVILVLISEINDLFVLNIVGVKLPVWAVIVIINIPWILSNYSKLLKEKIFSSLFYEYYYLIVLAIIFCFVFPWTSDVERAWNQGPIGRSMVSLIRLFCELMSLFYIYVLIASKKIKWVFLRNRFAIVVILSVIIAIIDYFTNYQFRHILFKVGDVPHRFLGFCGEPRFFGRTCLYTFVFFVCAFNTIEKKYTFSRKLILTACVVACLGAFLSMSVSAIALLLLSINIYTLLNLKKYFIFLTLVGTVLYFANINTFIKFDSNVQSRIDKISKGNEEDRINNEPVLFTRLEVFDRAAMNFLYNNKIYAVTGTGPNLISIPASNYLSRRDKTIYENQINSVPHTGAINVFARSGLIGLFLIVLFMFRIINASRKYKFSFQTIIIHSLIFLIIYDALYFMLIGISIGYFKLQLSKSISNSSCNTNNQNNNFYEPNQKKIRPIDKFVFEKYQGMTKC